MTTIDELITRCYELADYLAQEAKWYKKDPQTYHYYCGKSAAYEELARDLEEERRRGEGEG